MSNINDTNPIIDHFDGYGLNDIAEILRDERAPNAGGCSHDYAINVAGERKATIAFQHGARNVAGSTLGILDPALVAVLLDRYRGFQGGPFACRENAMVIQHLEEAPHWMRDRAWRRTAQGVLGTNRAHKSPK